MSDTASQLRPEKIGLFFRLWLNAITITVPIMFVLTVAFPRLPFTVATVFGVPFLLSVLFAISIHQKYADKDERPPWT